ncbi:MAG: recombination mediator RecR [Spirochaetes bacterium]|nr:recombination mediator RecR [Spirochaetota bacterium]
MAELNDLIQAFMTLPGIGRKSASRISTFLLKNKNRGKDLSRMITEVLEHIRGCSICGNYTTLETCSICTDVTRDTASLCIVEEQPDLIAIEETGIFRGLYHILGGVINPLEGIGPEQLRIKELNSRIQSSGFSEAIIATNPTVEGEATFLYLQNLLSPTGIKISRLATGIPMGSSLEYADRLTISKAFQSKLTVTRD